MTSPGAKPALNGGTLVHYQVTATGLGTRQVTGTSTTYSQVQATSVITFTIRAITRTSDGQLTGAPATAVHRTTKPRRRVVALPGSRSPRALRPVPTTAIGRTASG
ncbi:hypothetical protein [Kibdelosporangium philippinense]|uniref:hypothetical protein n=1 Tax=Kibdelosporangium philippinense TaxID=211113 RepID=UPI00360FC26A